MNNSYKLASEIDPNMMFLVNRSELEGRLDPYYYRDRLNFSNCIKLSKLAKIRGGKRIPLGYDYSQTETDNLYLRVSDMPDENDINFEKLRFISDELCDTLKRYETLENDLIISIAGTIGKIQIIRNIPQGKRIILTENCAKVVLTDNTIKPEYFALVLKTIFVQKQIALGYIQTTIPKLGLDKIQKLQIPKIPSSSTQQQIIDFYQEAYNQKLQKETEAKALLDSIDGYLLGKLAITLPEKDNSLEKRVFITQFSEVTGRRLDPFYYFISNYKIQGGIYENRKLKDIAILQKGQSITSSDVIEGNYPVIAGGQTSPYKHNSYNYSGNVITISASGAYSGYVWYHNYPIFASDCIVIKSKNESKISTLFLSEILKLKQQEIYNLQQGAGQPHVYASDLGNLLIPVPEEGYKQNEIAEHIQGIRQRAKQLQEEAKTLLEEAKQQVEQMILGD